MSIDAVGSYFSTLFINLCQTPQAHLPIQNKDLLLKSLHEALCPAPYFSRSPKKSPEIEQVRIKAVLLKLDEIHQLTHTIITEINNQKIIYVKYLSSRYGNNPNYTDPEALKAGRAIAQFYGKTCDLMNCVISREYPSLNYVMKQKFCDVCFEAYPGIRSIHDLMTLENAFGSKIPYRALVDLSLGREPNLAQCDKFVADAIQKGISSSVLHAGLYTIFKQAMTYHISPADQLTSTPFTLQRFEFALEERKKANSSTFENRDSELLTLADPLHMQWRASLTEGYKLSTIAKITREGIATTVLIEVTLGAPVGQSGKKIDRHIYFNIEKITCKPIPHDKIYDDFVSPLLDTDNIEEINSPLPPSTDMLVWISKNESMIGLRTERNHEHFGVEIVKTHLIAHNGHFALVEKLPILLGDPQWAKLMHLDPYKEVVINWLAWLAEKNKTPYPFKSKYLGLDADDTLRCVRLNVAADYNIQVLEKFALNTACSDPHLFKEYMEKSGLQKTSSAKIIIDAALSTFKKEQYDIDEQILIVAPRDLNVKEKAIGIQKKIKTRFKEMKQGKNLNVGKKNQLKQAILDEYVRSGAVTLLLPSTLDLK